MKLPKYKWKVGDAPTGRYRSFFNRSWPDASWQNEQETPCAPMSVEDSWMASYRGEYSKMEDVGADIKIRVALKSESSWEWKTLVTRARSIKQAKQIVADFWKANPHLIPDVVKGE